MLNLVNFAIVVARAFHDAWGTCYTRRTDGRDYVYEAWDQFEYECGEEWLFDAIFTASFEKHKAA